MTTVAILREPTDIGKIAYRAISGERQSVGGTAGEALDALTALLPDSETSTLVIVQNRHSDRFFTAEQQERLKTLMARWHVARDANTSLSVDEQTELEALVEAEVCAATERATAVLKELEP
jgi:citrate lyase gamma subunit